METVRTRAHLNAGTSIVITCHPPICSITITEDNGKVLRTHEAQSQPFSEANGDFAVVFTVTVAGYYITRISPPANSPVPPDFRCTVSYDVPK
jgi:hypothetical protein